MDSEGHGKVWGSKGFIGAEMEFRGQIWVWTSRNMSEDYRWVMRVQQEFENRDRIRVEKYLGPEKRSGGWRHFEAGMMFKEGRHKDSCDRIDLEE